MKANATSATASPDIRGPLMAWYAPWGRHSLPWRLTRDPYAVLVSEVMLQQTQVGRVLPYYERWLSLWPGFANLAAATAAEVIDLWAGLGYNRRALNLHRLANVVVAEHDGDLPNGAEALQSLPAIGPYTAAAIQCFAREERVVVADTNIARVIARAVFAVETAKLLPSNRVHEAAQQLLPAEGSRDHNLALMDLGAMVCSARHPACEVCPLMEACAWRRAGFPHADNAHAKSPPFEDTARFARGRIVDALRGSESVSVDDLANLLPERHAERVSEYLYALAREGMVEQHADGQWSLPGRVTAG